MPLFEVLRGDPAEDGPQSLDIVVTLAGQVLDQLVHVFVREHPGRLNGQDTV